MYNRLQDEEKFTVNMKFAKTVLQKDLTILNADESLYDFLGQNSKLFFNQLLHPDYVGEFDELCGIMQPEEEYRLLTLMRDRDGLYHPADIHMVLTNNLQEGEQRYLLDIYGLDKIESSFLDTQQKLDKYRTFMGMSELVYMEYWPESGRVVFYRYVAQKSHILYEDNIEQWHKDAVEYALNSGNNLAEIEQMYEKMKELANQFSVVIKSGFLGKDHIKETLEVQARYISRHNMEILVGIICRKDIHEDDVPYYLTAAGKDPATGLLNKRAIIDYTNDCLAVGENNKFYMILIDIDDFKKINDTYGHLAGDKAITLLAESLLEVLGERGIVGRFGGDEFFILTEEIKNEEQLRLFLKSLISKVKLTQVQELESIRFTLSMGISQYPEHGSTFKSMFALADKALYIAKEKGKNRYIIYRSELHDSVAAVKQGGEINTSGDQLIITKKAVRALMSEGTGALKETLLEVEKSFELDGITIFYGKELKESFTVGSCPERLKDISYIHAPSYSAMFFDDNMLVMNSIDNIERVDKEVYEMFCSVKCGAYIQMAFPNLSEARRVIAFHIFNRRHKWGDAEINCLEIIGNTVSRIWDPSGISPDIPVQTILQ